MNCPLSLTSSLPIALLVGALGVLCPVPAVAGSPQSAIPSVALVTPADRPGQAGQTTGTSTAESTDGTATAAQPQTPAKAADSDDARLASPTEPDYRLVNLATALRLPRHGATFELTHRFNGNLREGSFAENASSLFGMDDGAAIGLEFRYAVARHVEAAIYRTNIEKTIQFYTKVDAIHQHDGTPFSLSAVVSVEGTNNFHTNYQPGISIVLERSIASRLAAYVEPTYVGRTGVEAGQNQGTAFVGVGARARVRQRMYLVAEVSPRVSGYAPGRPEFGFGLEERVGGHVFQLNFTNTSSTTLGQVARGGFPNTLFLGFNLSRKFF